MKVRAHFLHLSVEGNGCYHLISTRKTMFFPGLVWGRAVEPNSESNACMQSETIKMDSVGCSWRHSQRERHYKQRYLLFHWTLLVFGDVTKLVSWEYKVLPLKTRVHVDRFTTERKPVIESVQNELNDLGKDGWELVSVQNIRLEDGRLFTVAYLKRQKL